MFFTKQPHPANFSFAVAYDSKSETMTVDDRKYRFEVRHFEGGITCLVVPGDGLWANNLCLEPCTPPDPVTGSEFVEIDPDGTIRIRLKRTSILEGFFGTSGATSMFRFRHNPNFRYYGMGEKSFGRFELSGLRSKFWNTDVLGDFHGAQWWEHPTDPYYASIPYLIVELDGTYVGLLLENPFPSFMDAGSNPFFFQEAANPDDLSVCLGSEDGQPRLWIIVGPTLPELTTKFTALTGRSERPPLWSLGYHQSRWGYGGEKDLRHLDRMLLKHKLPCDGLWLDIDYMDGYRVFSVDRRMFRKGIAWISNDLRINSRRIVAILDPGVKQDHSFEVYCSGLSSGIFAKNPAGKPFVGIVWPGLTVFPDFSLAKARKWWADNVEQFIRQGFGGVWIDMNDPSTGAVDPTAMLFGEGRVPHKAFRNQYALGMQMATKEGMSRANGYERPFIMSRSGFLGTPKHAALWTGDSVSNRFYLKSSVSMTLNMGLSGLAFHGHDIGGFMGDCTPDLFRDWVKAHFLFPIFRVHSDRASCPQEPWAFDPDTLVVARKFIELRYRFLPYLYQLFLEHERYGHPIIRPLSYHYSGCDALDDEFLIGDRLLQAPFLDAYATRRVVLPGDLWFDLQTMRLAIDEYAGAANEQDMTPLYVREASIVPLAETPTEAGRMDLSKVRLLVAPGGLGTFETTYAFDDGLTYDYREGKETRVQIRVEEDGEQCHVVTQYESAGAGPLSASFAILGNHRELVVNGEPVSIQRQKLPLMNPTGKAMTSKPLLIRPL